MPFEDANAALRDMLEAILSIERFVIEITFEGFSGTRRPARQSNASCWSSARLQSVWAIKQSDFVPAFPGATSAE